MRYCTGEAALAAEGLVGPAQVVWLNRVREDLESRDQFTRSVEAFQTLAIPWGVGNALTGLAAVALAT